MHYLQAINSDISILIVCNKTGGTIKKEIQKKMRAMTFRSTSNMRYAECMRNFGRKCKGKTPFSKPIGRGYGVKNKDCFPVGCDVSSVGRKSSCHTLNKRIDGSHRMGLDASRKRKILASTVDLTPLLRPSSS
jgi:hypothetical protein